MTMFKISAAALAAAAVPFALGAEAEAQNRAPQTYEECISQRQSQQLTGAVIGGLAGAVLGAQLHNRSEQVRRNDQQANQRWNRGGRGWDRGRGYRGRDTYQRRSNAGSVTAGAGLGAVGGALLGSAGPDCNSLPRRGAYGYSQHSNAQYNQGYAQPYSHQVQSQDYGWQGDSYGYQEPYYADQGYDPYHDEYGYDQGYSDQLAGGPGGYDPYQNQGYAAQSYGYPAPQMVSGNCRFIDTAGRRQQVCQSADGIWRPAGQH
jgi:hypothetical protein